MTCNKNITRLVWLINIQLSYVNNKNVSNLK